MKYEFREATTEDIDPAWEIIQQASKWLLTEFGQNHWDLYYTRQVVADKINDPQVFSLVAVSENETIGIAVYTSNPPGYYADESWSKPFTPTPTAGYLGMFGTNRDERFRGVGSALLEEIERVAKDNGITTLRFDTNAGVSSVVRFYEKRGYQRVGSVIDYDENPEGQEYHLYEKHL